MQEARVGSSSLMYQPEEAPWPQKDPVLLDRLDLLQNPGDSMPGTKPFWLPIPTLKLL